jgi:hypothetical protein
MRGLRDGIEVARDVTPVPDDGGLPTSDVVVAHRWWGRREHRELS